MPRPSVALVSALLVLAACGGGSSNAPAGPTPESVAVQASDLPSGLTRCDLSGDLDHFIAMEQTPDAQGAKTISDEWQQAKKNGAVAAYAALYTDSAAHCNAIKGSGADLGAATYKLVVNFVIQYKDEKSAVNAYKGQNPILGFNPNELRTGGGGVVEGAQTGLTENSIALTQPAGNQLFYIAIWQDKTFVVILAILNVDANTAKNVGVRENSRIK
jgi:hypothetical protein